MIFGDLYLTFPETFPKLSATSIYFVIFAFIVFALSRPFKNKFRPYILLIANIIFLLSFSTYHLIAVLLLSIVSYIFGLLINKYKNKSILFCSVIPFIITLAIFKYYDLFTGQSLIMPLGLSFYTFIILSYLIDIYKDKVEVEKNIIYYLDYVMFFPVITAGPINRSKEFFIELKSRNEFDYVDAKNGAVQMMLGIFEKKVFCDYVGIIVNQILNNNELYGINVFFGIILYSFYIYLDFDSISNIAIGLSRLLGFHLHKNFNSPYLASNLKDFWRRWHISLSTWLRDYVYIPLGGSRKGKYYRFLNLIIVFLVSGIWHGSTINFVLWGLLHALIQIIEDIIIEPLKKVNFNKFSKVLLKIFGIALNFTIVTFLWLIFKYQTMDEVFNVLNRMFTAAPFSFEAIGLIRNEGIWLAIILLLTVIFDILRDKFDMIDFLSKRNFIIRWAFYTLLIVVFLVFGVYGGSFEASDFIYQFF